MTSIDRLLMNYSNALKSWEVWCFMSGLDNELKQKDRETKSKVDKDPLLFHLRFLAMKDLHIELYKILRKSKNNQDNIFYLLADEIRKKPNEGEGVAAKLIEEKLNKSKLLTDAVCVARDKFYAHLDEEFEKYIQKKSYAKDLQHLFDLIEEAIMVLTSPDKVAEVKLGIEILGSERR